MNDKTTLEIIAPTVEEAIAQGLMQLGLTADAVSVEVLDAGNKGLFGLGKPQVRVRLTVVPPMDTSPVSEVDEVRTEPAVPKKETKRVEKKPEPRVQTQAPSSLVQDKPVSVIQAESQPEHDPVLDHTEAVISKLLHLLNLEAQVSAHYGAAGRDERRNINVDVRGNDLSVLIGRRSETLSAFQYVASLIVGKETGQFVQLTVDVEGYRDRREKQLVQMAKRMADQVAKNGRRQTLEPMPSDERRIIHIALRDHPEVTTESTGD
ncbi:MAG: RNA-binding cell elongation regulator Jag/EloR, partial [Chloroflexota bacterium]